MTRDEMLRVTRGIALAPITPFTKEGEVDEKGIYRLVEFFLEKGLNGGNGFLIPLSTTGSFLSLSLEERKHVIDVFIKAVSGHIPIVAGCNHISLSDTLELAKFSQNKGAVGIMVSPPFYWKPTDAQIVNHYDNICKSIEIGVIIYNNHWASQNDISPDTIEKILENPNLIGLKESTHSIIKLTQISRRFANRINVFNGLGEAYEPMYTHLGNKGFTSTLGNIVPEFSVQLYSKLLQNKFEEASQLAGQITPLSDFLDSLTGGQYIAALKHMLNRLGICEDRVRPPILSLEDQQIEKLEKLVETVSSATRP